MEIENTFSFCNGYVCVFQQYAHAIHFSKLSLDSLRPTMPMLKLCYRCPADSLPQTDWPQASSAAADGVANDSGGVEALLLATARQIVSVKTLNWISISRLLQFIGGSVYNRETWQHRLRRCSAKTVARSGS